LVHKFFKLQIFVTYNVFICTCNFLTIFSGRTSPVLLFWVNCFCRILVKCTRGGLQIFIQIW
jgi:hypothetical protein